MSGVESCILLARKIGSSKAATYIIPNIKRYGEEKSWRLRYLVADKIVDLAEGLGEEMTQQKLVS